jgi:hypothetical protein
MESASGGREMKMPSFMELIYIDIEDNARQTGLRRSLDTDAATWAEFRSFRRHSVDIKQARYLLDYHNPKGDCSHTIAIDRAGFKAITGQIPKTNAEYCKIDSDFWDEVRSEAA